MYLKFYFMSAILLLGLSVTASAQTTIDEQLENAPPIYKVEEDWELKVVNPDPTLDIPQIVTVFGPTNAFFDTHTVFELNHGTLPTFGQGGMQLQVWYGDWLVGYLQQQQPTELNTADEIISYTTVTRINDDILTMEVKNGTSTTYGNFGAPGHLRVRLYTYRNDLNPYEPNNSIRHSRVTFGANRVSYFKRKAIRVYVQNGDLYAQDDSDQFVHQLAEE